jgi:hypothetical protein
MIPHRSRSTLPQELPIPHTPLLPQSGTLLLLNEAIKLALDTLETASLAIRELAIESLADLLPLLTQIHAVVPDEVHFLFFVLWPRGTTTVAVSGGGA